MPIARPVDLRLPVDLADLLDDVSLPAGAEVRSAPLELLDSATTIAATTITLIQGPPAVAYWTDAIRRWIDQRRAAGRPVSTLSMTGPDGVHVSVPINQETDVAELARVIHKALFPKQRSGGLEAPVEDDRL